MLNGSSPYIHPDYYDPLPSPIDAKFSPLALLAKTCNSIGKDNSPTKSVLQSLEKKDGEQSPQTDKRPISVDANDTKDILEKSGFRTIHLNDVQTSTAKSAPAENIDQERDSKKKNNLPPPESSKVNASSESPHQSSSPVNNKSSLLQNQTSLSSSLMSGHLLNSDLSSSSAGLGYSGFPYLGHGINPELAAAYHQSQLLAQSAMFGLSASSLKESAIKAGAAAASMNPYVSYTRVRSPSGATTLVPVCKDPYCSNCQLSVQTSHSSATCKTAGCSQCAHEKALLGLSVGAAGLGLQGNIMSFYPRLASCTPNAVGIPSLHSLYPHSALSAHQGLPYVCNWVAGNGYCGKTFGSTEELMQHLKCHTPDIESSLPIGYGLGLPPAISTASVELYSPESLRRVYPTSVSPGLLAGSRYHPYKSPLSNSPGSPSASQLSHLSAYYPYSLYAHRMGAVP